MVVVRRGGRSVRGGGSYCFMDVEFALRNLKRVEMDGSDGCSEKVT